MTWTGTPDGSRIPKTIPAEKYRCERHAKVLRFMNFANNFEPYVVRERLQMNKECVMTEEITNRWLMDLGFVGRSSVGIGRCTDEFLQMRCSASTSADVARIDGVWNLGFGSTWYELNLGVQLNYVMTRTRLQHLLIGLGFVIQEYTSLSPDEEVIRGDECRSRQDQSQGWMETAVRGAQSTEHEYRRPTNNLQEQIKCTQ
jgi:hypothetical protein